MVWNNQSGGGGPWGGGSNNSNNSRPPSDFDDILKKGQDNLRRMIPHGRKPVQVLTAALVFVVGLWLATGFYQVQEGEQGAVLQFGKWVKTTHAGINYHLPYPIETVIVQKVDEINVINSGMTLKSSNSLNDDDSGNFMLTGDENIVSVNFTVQWFIKDIGNYLFKISEPELTVKQAALSALREIVAQTPLEHALTKGRGEIADKAQVVLQYMLDHYQSGIQVVRIQLKSIDPPQAVIDAFRDVQRARADYERLINEATAYSNAEIPKAKGEASRETQSAEGYRRAVVDEAIGRTSRFLAILKEYTQAPQVTRQRLYLQTMQNVFKGTNKFVIQGQTAGQVLPHIPLTMLKGATPIDVKESTHDTK